MPMDTWSLEPLLVSAAGGVLIGLSAVLMMAFSGRIAGVSGIVGGLLPPVPVPDWAWRIAFAAGLLIGPWLVALLTAELPIGRPTVGWMPLLAAGLLVGVGTSLGNGCTSGHGVCGLARLSMRSLVAVAIFMATAAGTVFVLRHAV